MPEMTATEAKNKFGQVLELAHAGPVHIQKHGRDVAVVLSAQQYQELVERAAATKVRPVVERLMERSLERRRSLYEALAR